MQKLYVKDKQFYKSAFGIALPIALQGLITTGVNMADNIMVNEVGQTQFAAVSAANQFISIFHIFSYLGFALTCLKQSLFFAYFTRFLWYVCQILVQMHSKT